MERGKDLTFTNPKPKASISKARPKNSKPLHSSSSSSISRSFSTHYCCFHFYISLLHPKSSSPPCSIIKTQKKQQPSSAHHLVPSLLLIFAFLGFSAFYISPRNVPIPVARKIYLETGSFASLRPALVPLPVHETMVNRSAEEWEFWRQPDGLGYRPCIRFSLEYRKASGRIVAEQRWFLVVVASGELNQQRNQIVDAVVIARVLGAALVVPVLKVNVVWGDESEFSDIFDVDHFRRILQSDIRIVEALPSTHLISRKTTNGPQIPFDSSPFLIRRILLTQLYKDGVVILKGLDSKLSKTLPPDLQKLRCKVAFHALRFITPIQELGSKLTQRMWFGGPYIAIHLRLEKDVWVRTGCLPGLGPELDKAIVKERAFHPELLTDRLSMSHNDRKLAGLCPLTAHEVARFLKALGAPRTARLYLAGGEPFGGDRALLPLTSEFPDVVTKETLATEGELGPYADSSSALAAVDFIIALNSDVFLPSHGGNMGRTLQGYRAYAGGHRKVVEPNKRGLAAVFENTTASEEELRVAVRRMHRDGLQELRWRTGGGGDVITYPTTSCMCKSTSTSTPFASLEL